ncbi:MAG: hypothetical protein GXP26_01445 [Planctomycetes bacterium]|nr:hypothetical protein [Planctomycetota bacterium]
MESIYWPTFFFWLFSLISCSFAVGVLLASNIVRMAFYLVLSLASIAGLFFLAGADFVGAMQIMIYVGGTLVLLIFGVMLTSQERFIEMKTPSGEWVIAFFIGASLLGLLFQVAQGVPAWQGMDRLEAEAIAVEKTATPIGMGLLGVRVDKLDETDKSRQAGMSGYLLIFEIVSVHLLVVLIGAAYLARAKRKQNRENLASVT